MGQIWLESLRQGSFRRGEEKSIWTNEDEYKTEQLKINTDRYLDPFVMAHESFVGSDLLPGMVVIHEEECFNVEDKQFKKRY